MSNQDIVDSVEFYLPNNLPARVKEKVLDAVWDVLNNELGIDLEAE